MKTKAQFRFICIFFVLLIAGQGIYYLSKTRFENLIVNRLNVGVSVKIINLISPQEHAVQKGKNILGSNISMTVATGCDGMDGLIVVIAAILAFPMAFLNRIKGMLLGISVVYITNLLRIVMLFFTLRFQSGWFDFMHIYIGQFIVIFTAGLFFLIWINYTSKKEKLSGEQ